MKSAAISNLAQKLASPTPPFSSPILPPVLDTTANAAESTLDKADADADADADLKETLFDLDELLKKELEESAKDEPAVETEEVKVEPLTKCTLYGQSVSWCVLVGGLTKPQAKKQN